MLYRLYFKDIAGHRITLSGFKDVKDDPGFDAWSDTSTLYTQLYKGYITTEDEKQIETVRRNYQYSSFGLPQTTNHLPHGGATNHARASALLDLASFPW